MNEELQQQSQSEAPQEREAVKIANPLEHLKSSSEKIAKFGGFDLIESSIDGAQNLNPERKARRNIFLSEAQKKGEREQLLGTLQVWAEALNSSNEISDMVTHSEQKAAQCQQVLEKNLAKAIDESKDLEDLIATLHCFLKTPKVTSLRMCRS